MIDEQFKKNDLVEFLSLQPTIVADITSIPPYNKLPFLTDRITSMLNYNINGGNNTSGVTTVFIYKMVSKPQDRTSEKMKQAIILGWCIRIVSI